MKKLLITLLLISPFSFADWGDVYYCQMTHASSLTMNGESTARPLDKFVFRLDQEKSAMVFSGSGYFFDTEYKLREGHIFLSQESWYADGQWQSLAYDKGKMLFSAVGYPAGINTISADCEKL